MSFNMRLSIFVLFCIQRYTLMCRKISHFFIFLISMTALIIQKKDRVSRMLGIWFIAGIIFASSTGRTIYDHYVLYLYPFPFIFAGILLRDKYNQKISNLVMACGGIFFASPKNILSKGAKYNSGTRT